MRAYSGGVAILLLLPVGLAGHTVIPGLIGLHDHICYTTLGGSEIQSNYSFPRLDLASGVTTVRTTGSFSPHAELNLKGGIDRGDVPGPRMHVTGPAARLDLLGMHEVATEAAAGCR